METAANRMATAEFDASRVHWGLQANTPENSSLSRMRRLAAGRTIHRHRPHGRQVQAKSHSSRLPALCAGHFEVSTTSVAQNEATLARRGASICWSRLPTAPVPLMTLTRLAVGLEPLNALDAAHRAPRSAGQKPVAETGSPAGSATHRSIELNKELAQCSNRPRQSQVPDVFAPRRLTGPRQARFYSLTFSPAFAAIQPRW